MRRVSIREYEGFARRDVPASPLRRLQELDEKLSVRLNDSVFDWSRRAEVRAKNYVGVIQVPGLALEILPKVDSTDTCDEKGQRARANLLFMLSYIRKIPIRERDIAQLQRQEQPLVEVLIAIFTNHLIEEIRKGVDHSYVDREENLPYLRGRLLFSEHMRRNAAHRERVYVAFDEFLPDTWLNRVLKAACRRLLDVTRVNQTELRLREAILCFEMVTDLPIEIHHFELVQLNRNSERYRNLLEFARMVLCEAAPTPEIGERQTFSLLYPMEMVFEEFIGEFIRRHCSEFGFERGSVHLQARRMRRWLVRDAEGVGRFRLKPDILVGSKADTQMIIDTKWKRLLPDVVDSRNGVSQADLYQLFAYAERYECRDNVLLYPKVPGVTAKRYVVDGDADGKRLRVEFVDVGRDLLRDKIRLRDELWAILQGTAPLDESALMLDVGRGP